MRKTAAQAEKAILLARMERERRELAQLFAAPQTAAHAGAEKPPLMQRWSTTSVLVSAAAIGWPPFLRQPLRALAAIAVRNRIKSLTQRRPNRPVSQPLREEEIARLTQLMATLRDAAEHAADPAEVERLRAQLDEQVRLLRIARARQAGQAQSQAPLPRQGNTL